MQRAKAVRTKDGASSTLVTFVSGLQWNPIRRPHLHWNGQAKPPRVDCFEGAPRASNHRPPVDYPRQR